MSADGPHEHDGVELYKGNPVVTDVTADDFDRFVGDYCGDEIADLARLYPSEKRVVEIDLADVYAWHPDVADHVRQSPDPYADAFAHAVEQHLGPAHDDDLDAEALTVRYRNAGDAVTVPDLLRGDDVGRLVTLRGQASKVTEVQARFTEALIRCKNCHTSFRVRYPEHGDLDLSTCRGADCRSSRLEPVYRQTDREYHQLARIKQPTERDDSDAHVDVHLTKDAAGRLEGGERVDVTGVVRAHTEDVADPYPEFYMTDATVDLHEASYETIDTSDNRETFEAHAAGEHGDPYQLLIDSVAPGLIDPEDSDGELTKIDAVKLAVGLQLFSGWRRDLSGGNSIRGDIHIALIGDPATGKSRVLDAAEQLSPRSSYVSGKNATKNGVTAAAVRDDFGDTEWSLDAGAFVIAHGGVCCIDEIDKVGGEVASSLHTALEKQRLEVAKAGINSTLKCETSLLAAGNPEGERFIDEVQNVEQINIEPALYSRFDLLFCLEDPVEEDRDRRIADHVLKTSIETAKVEHGERDALSGEVEPAVDPDVLRAWIAEARERTQPYIQDEAVKDALVDYHVRLRSASDETAPITTRKLEALRRLCEASARVRLDDEITMRDVELVKQLVGVSMGDVGLKDGKPAEPASVTHVDHGPDADDDDADEYAQAKPKVYEYLRDEGGKLLPDTIARDTGIREDKVRDVLGILEEQGDVSGQQGRYEVVGR